MTEKFCSSNIFTSFFETELSKLETCSGIIHLKMLFLGFSETKNDFPKKSNRTNYLFQFHVAIFDYTGKFVSHFHCPQVKVSRCCGLKLTSEGYIVTLAKNNHHALVLNALFVD